MFRNRNPILAMLVVGLFTTPSARWLWGADPSGTLSGTVRTPSGEAAEGAFVRAKHLDRKVAFTVISQQQGRYTLGGLPAGQYAVQAWGGGYQSDGKTAVEVSGRSTMDLSLTMPQDLQDAMTTTRWAQMLPEGDARYVLTAGCTECHSNRDRSLRQILATRKTREGWRETVDKMRNRPYGYPISLHISDQERDVVAEYLAKHFGPASPSLDFERSRPQTWVKGPPAKVLFVEYDVLAGAEPHDVAVDSQGIGWATHGYHGKVNKGMLFRIDPALHTYTSIPVPESEKSGSNGVEIDAQDRVWVSDGTNSRLLRYDPKTKEFASFVVPLAKSGRGANSNTIRIGRDGTVWGTEISNNQIVRIDQKTKEVVEYPVPAGVARNDNASPYGMAIAADGTVWFAERFTDKVGRVDPKTGQITEYDIPTKHSDVRRGAADAEGNVWFGACGTGKLVKADYRTKQVTEYAVPTRDSCPYSVDVDRKRNLIWTGEMMADQLARFDPKTNRWVEYPLPTHYSSVRRIEVDQNRPNRVWFAERGVGVDKVGYLEVLE